MLPSYKIFTGPHTTEPPRLQAFAGSEWGVLQKDRTEASAVSAVSASVPFRDNLNGTTLRSILASGVAPGQW